MIAVALLLLVTARSASGAAPVSADPPSPSASPGAAKAAKTAKVSDRDKMVCRVSAPTGRHIVERECHSQLDWDRMEADGKAYTDRSLRSQNVGPPGSF